MIAHVSVPSRDPRRTALLLAALMDGEVFPFPVVPGAWIAVARDGSGQAVEVYPPTLAHHPGRGEADPAAVPQGPQTLPWEDQIHADADQLRATAFHFAVTTPLPYERVLALAKAAGWRAVQCNRGGVFGLVEVWLEGQFLVEVLGPDDALRYRRFMNPAACAAMFGPPVALS